MYVHPGTFTQTHTHTCHTQAHTHVLTLVHFTTQQHQNYGIPCQSRVIDHHILRMKANGVHSKR